MVENTSPVHITLRWRTPYHNGAKVLDFDFRYNDENEHLPLPRWVALAPEEVMLIKQVSEVTEGAFTFAVFNLRPRRAHFFKFRARNSVGFSDWSEVATFWTRPSPPARVEQVKRIVNQPKKMGLSWAVPDNFGCPIKRYEVLTSRNLAVLRWARLVCEKLWWTPSLEQVLGVFHMVDVTIKEAGRERLLDFDGDAAFFLPVDDHPTCEVEELLPGKNYHVMTRAVSDYGMGKWSAPLSPLKVPPTEPRRPQPLRIENIGGDNCGVSVQLPYDNGQFIAEIVVAVAHCQGPLADQELDSQVVVVERSLGGALRPVEGTNDRRR